jgi:hypothetical protein
MTTQSAMVAYPLCALSGDSYAYADALLGPSQPLYPVASPAVALCSTTQNRATAAPVIHGATQSPTPKVASLRSASSRN